MISNNRNRQHIGYCGFSAAINTVSPFTDASTRRNFFATTHLSCKLLKGTGFIMRVSVSTISGPSYMIPIPSSGSHEWCVMANVGQ